MKTLAAILFGSIFFIGCSEKIQNRTMKWDDSSVLYTNQNLVIFAKSGIIQTNVDSLEQASEILGQYGWEFVSSDVENGETVYHMKRQARGDCDFNLIPNIVPISQ